MMSSPGTGKSILPQCLPTILQLLTPSGSLETTRICSADVTPGQSSY
ncbi:MAG: ATP-binding protein [Planctomycetes bacterium]|nr:ATP-binding protein [Planctomycetota bacterium]